MKKISCKLKNLLLALVVLGVIILFALTAVNAYREKNKPVIDAIKTESKLTREALEKSKKSKDSLIGVVKELKGEVKAHDTLLYNSIIENKETQEQLKNIRNEKNNIPNIPINKQLEYISNYKYHELK